MTGIKHSGNRPKAAKHLRGVKKKKHKDPIKIAEYEAKLRLRAARKLKKKNKRK